MYQFLYELECSSASNISTNRDVSMRRVPDTFCMIRNWLNTIVHILGSSLPTPNEKAILGNENEFVGYIIFKKTTTRISGFSTKPL